MVHFPRRMFLASIQQFRNCQATLNNSQQCYWPYVFLSIFPKENLDITQKRKLCQIVFHILPFSKKEISEIPFYHKFSKNDNIISSKLHRKKFPSNKNYQIRLRKRKTKREILDIYRHWQLEWNSLLIFFYRNIRIWWAQEIVPPLGCCIIRR